MLSWDIHRLPIVSEEERPLILGMWKEACRGRIPQMRYLPFAEIRKKSPEEFIEILVHELGAAGIVAGSNYRFGKKKRLP